MRPNRYARKCKHKRVLKKRHAVKFDRFDPLLDEEKERNDYWDDLVNYPRAKWIDHRFCGFKIYWDGNIGYGWLANYDLMPKTFGFQHNGWMLYNCRPLPLVKVHPQLVKLID